MTNSPADENLLQRFTTDAPAGHPNQRPRDASTLILLDRTGPEPKVLMGKRHQRHVFMPGHFVFPGGRIDPADRRMPVAAPLDPRAEQKLMLKIRRPSVARARALALTAIRETFEETGLLLGAKNAETLDAPDAAWSAFAEAKVRPDLSNMHFIARAVTPPRRARRYDTRFFTADITAIAHKVDGKVGPDAELVDLVWLPLSQIKQRIELMAITELVLRDLQGLLEKGFSHDLPVPYYHGVSGRRVRDFL
jgi:8-oxo-dGTP pyrophosphatase MutT (NUDIX family)